MPDVDIDFFDRDGVLKLFKHTPASMIKEGNVEKHKTGVYFHAVPSDPINDWASLDYKEADDLVISWWQFTWKNKSSGKEAPVHLMIGHFFNNNNKMTSETYYFNPSTLPK